MKTIIPLGQKKVGALVYRAFWVDNKYVIARQNNGNVDNFVFDYCVLSDSASFAAGFASPSTLTFDVNSVNSLVNVDVVTVLSRFSNYETAY